MPDVENPLETIAFEQMAEEDQPEETPEDTETPEPTEGGEPAPPAEPDPEPDPVAQLRAEMEAERAEWRQEREWFKQQLAKGQPEQPKGEPRRTAEDIAAEYFGEGSADGLKAVVAALRDEMRSEFAPRSEFSQVQQSTFQNQMLAAEQRAMKDLIAEGETEADVQEANRRAYDEWNKSDKSRALYPDPRTGLEVHLRRIHRERAAKGADAAAKREDAVHKRQQTTVATPSSPPTGKGKVNLEVRPLREKFRKEHGHYPRSTQEWMEYMDKHSS